MFILYPLLVLFIEGGGGGRGEGRRRKAEVKMSKETAAEFQKETNTLPIIQSKGNGCY